ncbi:MTRF1L release factor glutamine methyltransferase-like isoform X2 [Gigantopelta aegis]|uniref:MTRF1L release factor glutamine methyltransferase-like isoform X2 n=1 Tax=Gigantopelta aegis TaxID=1735272 RepID=UPI001B887C53|nr:MTRF1L release factor glutamine methyltransferase-like isoform X2 [Gigantopelta aegis]
MLKLFHKSRVLVSSYYPVVVPYWRRSCSSMTVGSICKSFTRQLEQENVPEAKISIDLMVAHVLGKTTLHGVTPSTHLNTDQIRQLESMCEQRKRRMPVQYIIGEWDFCDLMLKVQPPTLIPRPETEELANYVISHVRRVRQNQVKILDIGSGSGALIIAILHALPTATGVAVDIADHACSLTSENAQLTGVHHRLIVEKLDITTDVAELSRLCPFDLIVGNPPYLTDECLNNLETELSYEDNKALYGGPDGLDVTRSILAAASRLLRPNGSVWMELGLGQPLEIKTLLEKQTGYHLQHVETLQDFTNRDRFCHLEYKLLTNEDPSSQKYFAVPVM